MTSYVTSVNRTLCLYKWQYNYWHRLNVSGIYVFSEKYMYVYKLSYQKMDKKMNAYVRPTDPLHLNQLLMSQNGVLVENNTCITQQSTDNLH